MNVFECVGIILFFYEDPEMELSLDNLTNSQGICFVIKLPESRAPNLYAIILIQNKKKSHVKSSWARKTEFLR